MKEHLSQASGTETASSTLHDRQAPLIALGAKLFLGESAVRTVAVVACTQGEGSTYVTRELSSFLQRQMGLDAQTVSPEQFLGNGSIADTSNRIVLVDCPALFSSADALRAVSKVEGVLLVVQDGLHAKGDLRRAVTIIEAAQGHVLGTVLNKYSSPLPNWLRELIA